MAQVKNYTTLSEIDEAISNATRQQNILSKSLNEINTVLGLLQEQRDSLSNNGETPYMDYQSLLDKYDFDCDGKISIIDFNILFGSLYGSAFVTQNRAYDANNKTFNGKSLDITKDGNITITDIVNFIDVLTTDLHNILDCQLITYRNDNGYNDLDTIEYYWNMYGRIPTLEEVKHYNSNGANYLTFESLEDNNEIYLKCTSIDENTKRTIQWKLSNSNTWNEVTSTYAGTLITTINAGEKIYFKGENSDYNGTRFNTSKTFNINGNIMSLLYGDNFNENSTFNSNHAIFYGLFRNSLLINAENLILPATTLTDYCYNFMFMNCKSLITTPKLPATTLATGCYSGMFWGCTSLTTTPELPATILADICYGGMFRDCTSLTTILELPATTLARSCYREMFQGCTSLTKAPNLSATTLTYECYANMFSGCTSLIATPTLPATTLAQSCYQNMFLNCTSLTKVSKLPATTLAYNCYASMFGGCTSLTKAPELPATKLARFCYLDMFDSCTSLTIAPKLPATTLVQHCYQGMFFGCKSLTSAPTLNARTLVDNCYKNMFAYCTNINFIKCLATDIESNTALIDWLDGVSTVGTFITNNSKPAYQWPKGTSGIPTNWKTYTVSGYANYINGNSSYNSSIGGFDSPTGNSPYIG